MGLLEDLSGDEDDFTALSRDRVGSKADDSYAPTETSAANFFSTQFDTQDQQGGDANFFDSDFGEPVAAGDGGRVGDGGGGGGVDLLNINNVNSNKNPQPDVVANQLGDFTLGGEGAESGENLLPSNVDLLAGGADFASSSSAAQSSATSGEGGSGRGGPVPDLMGGMVEDTFDPFQQFNTPAPKADAPPLGTFDPFQEAQVSSDACLSYFCCHKSILLSRQKTCFVTTSILLLRQKTCFVTTSILLSRQKTCFVTTSILLSRQKMWFVTTNTCLLLQK